MGTHAPLGSGTPRATVFKARTRRRGVLPLEHTLAARACGAPGSLDSPCPPPFSDWQGCPCAALPVLHSCCSLTAAAVSQRRLMLSTRLPPKQTRTLPFGCRRSFAQAPLAGLLLRSARALLLIGGYIRKPPPSAPGLCNRTLAAARRCFGGARRPYNHCVCTLDVHPQNTFARPPQHAAFARPCADCGPPFKHTQTRHKLLISHTNTCTTHVTHTLVLPAAAAPSRPPTGRHCLPTAADLSVAAGGSNQTTAFFKHFSLGGTWGLAF